MTTDDVTPPPAYKDDDLVYVDPDTKTVIGLVEWSRSGNPKSKQASSDQLEEEETTEAKGPGPKPAKKDRLRKRGSGRKIYPWGTYKAMKRVFQVEGKPKKTEANKTLDEILPKALEQAFWD